MNFVDPMLNSSWLSSSSWLSTRLSYRVWRNSRWTRIWRGSPGSASRPSVWASWTWRAYGARSSRWPRCAAGRNNVQSTANGHPVHRIRRRRPVGSCQKSTEISCISHVQASKHNEQDNSASITTAGARHSYYLICILAQYIHRPFEY